MNDSEGKFWKGMAAGWFATKLFSSDRGNNSSVNTNISDDNSSDSILGVVLTVISAVVAWNVGHESGFVAGVIAFFVTPIVLLAVYLIGGEILRNVLTAGKKKEEEILNLYNMGQYTLALEKAESLASKSPIAADLAGVCYDEGLGCSKDKSKALSYFSMAKDKNFEAAYYYGAMLAFADGEEQTKREGFEYLKKAALSGQYNAAGADYGYALFKGFGCEKNQAEGIKQLRIFSDLGYSSAKYWLGCILYSGEDGVASKEDEGVRFLREAANAGDEMAEDYLREIGMA